MSVSSLGAPSSAHSYLRSLLQQQRTNARDGGQAADPLAMLLNSFYPGADGSRSASAGGQDPATTNASGAVAPITPDTMTSLLAVQAQGGAPGAGSDVAARAHDLFGKFDTDGDGRISKSEFETAFGSGADMTTVDGLFNALDSNHDGAIGEDELTSAAQSAARHHHHHDAHRAGPGEGSLLDMLKSGADGSTTERIANADGSTTTTISYADGSKITMTSPAASTSGPTNDSRRNVLEQLIALQAQWSMSASGTTA